MNKRIISFITASFAVLSLAACGNKKQSGGHHFTENYLFDAQKHWKECTDDNCFQQKDVSIHEFLEWTTVEDSTCNKVGKEISKCSVCEYVIEREIPMKDHVVGGEWVTDENSHWHNCANDPEEKVDFNSHSLKWVYKTEPTCTEPGEGHQECEVCGYRFADQAVSAFGHDWKIDEEHTQYATCTEPGTVTHVCGRCGVSQTKPVAAGHNWRQPTYEWSEDLGKVTATRICDNNPDHVETETVTTNKSHLAPTCEAEGNNTYTTNAFTNPAFKEQSKVIKLEKCSETLEHHCEAEKYVAGDIYDECKLCHTKYNVVSCSAPWEDFDFGTEMEEVVAEENGAGVTSTYDATTKTLTLAKHSGRSAFISFRSKQPVAKSAHKNYFVLTYTLLEDSGGWWDTYLTVSGKGTPSKIRFGQINADAVANYDMSIVTFVVDDEVVGWNAVKKGGTGTLFLNLGGLKDGANDVMFSSDGGAKLRIDYAGFRSSMCDHDASCYKTSYGSTCAGLITTTADQCQECHKTVNERSSGLPKGYQALDLTHPLGVRWESKYFDYSKHIITSASTYLGGPKYEAPKGTRLIIQANLTYDPTCVASGFEADPDPVNAGFEIRFMNNELTTAGSDNMYTHFYKFVSTPTGIVTDNAGITNPASVNDLAKLLNNETGEQISHVTIGESFVLDIDISNKTLSDFAQILMCGTVGSIITIENVIYC